MIFSAQYVKSTSIQLQGVLRLKIVYIEFFVINNAQVCSDIRCVTHFVTGESQINRKVDKYLIYLHGPKGSCI